MLTIVTLGIYSAWATVRTNRYFYANTYLDNQSFRYLADPITILKGRIIAVVAFILYSVALNLLPVVGLALAVALFFAIPFFVIRSIAFNNRMTSYRNVQFRFSGAYGEAFMVLLVWPLLGMLTLGILYPFALLKANEFVVRNCAYGTTSFNFEAKTWDYGKVFLLFIGILAATAVLAFVAGTVFEIAAVIVAALGYVLALGYLTVELINIYYNATSLGAHRLSANLDTVGYLKVFVSNAVLTVLTLGLYLPFAQVRMSNYRANHTTFLASGSLDDFTAAEQQRVSALGDELGDVFDFDVGAF
jgi:uncharacterized membrane protein YjgN (DUF898 family)